MKSRRPFLHVVLLLLLLCSQQMGMSHAVTHVLHAAAAPSGTTGAEPAGAHERALPAELQCVKCLVFASIGSGLVDGAPQRCSDPQTGPHHIRSAAAPAALPLLRAFDSRAPPVAG